MDSSILKVGIYKLPTSSQRFREVKSKVAALFSVLPFQYREHPGDEVAKLQNFLFLKEFQGLTYKPITSKWFTSSMNCPIWLASSGKWYAPLDEDGAIFGQIT